MLTADNFDPQGGISVTARTGQYFATMAIVHAEYMVTVLSHLFDLPSS